MLYKKTLFIFTDHNVLMKYTVTTVIKEDSFPTNNNGVPSTRLHDHEGQYHACALKLSAK